MDKIDTITDGKYFGEAILICSHSFILHKNGEKFWLISFFPTFSFVFQQAKDLILNNLKSQYFLYDIGFLQIKIKNNTAFKET